MNLMKHPFLIAFCFIGILIYSCKKTDVRNAASSLTPSADSLAANNARDSALLAAKDVYLWYNQIPNTFNARAYNDPAAIMKGIRQYSIEPGFSQPVDRWSFAMKQKEWNNLSAGISADFGISVFFLKEGDLRVKAVEPASPAGKAGIRRGWRLTAINGSNNITTINAQYIIDNIYHSQNSSIVFEKPDLSQVTIGLNAASYQTQPVILDSIYSINSKTIGYFSFNSFLGDTSEINHQFSRIFNRFGAAGVQDVVIDLRYNGGGYVSIAQKMVNYLAPFSANGGLMMTQKYNDKYTQYNQSKYIQKLGPLNLSRIFFIVSKGTASASELVINNLRPYLNILLVGPSATYGKPVGFFPIPSGDWFNFPVSFRSANKSGEGNYFNGIAVNSATPDGLDKNWGDVTENDLSSAIRYITTGVFKMTVQPKENTAQPALERIERANDSMDFPNFKGMISK
ncbi:MAG: S41 family peptidase [Flavisolibacter sp.]